MKHFFLLLLACSGIAAACIKLTPVNYSSFIEMYESYPQDLEIGAYSVPGAPSMLRLSVEMGERSPRYTILSTGEEREKFDELCDKHGDTNYPNAKKYWSSMNDMTYVMTPDLKTIDIVADKDFDKDHPAGASLSDCVELEVMSYQSYIDSGYDEALKGKWWTIKRLDQVEEKDIALTPRFYWLDFLAVPDDPSAEITYTVISENVIGEIQKGSVTCRFPEP